MNSFFELFYFASRAVGTIFFTAAAGALIVKFKIVSKDSLNMLSKLVFYIMLPCLLFTKVAQSVNLSRLSTYWILPVSCAGYIFLGLLIGKIAVKLCRPRAEMAPGVATSIAFGNSGYLPIPLLTAVTLIFPYFADNKGAADEAVALISVFLICFSPIMWTIGFSIISGQRIRHLSLKKIFTPPVIGMLSGLIIGLVPSLKNLFCVNSGFFQPVFHSANTLAGATVPCALIILGGRLADGPVRGVVNKRTILTVIMTKLIIFPLIAILYVLLLRHLNLIPATLLLALVLIVEAGTPPANNLVVMASLTNRKLEDGLATILFWSYLAAVPTLTLIIMLTVHIFK